MFAGYVLVREDGKFVAPSGQDESYTSDLTKARIFKTREEAEADRCVDNERIADVVSLLRGVDRTI